MERLEIPASINASKLKVFRLIRGCDQICFLPKAGQLPLAINRRPCTISNLGRHLWTNSAVIACQSSCKEMVDSHSILLLFV